MKALCQAVFCERSPTLVALYYTVVQQLLVPLFWRCIRCCVYDCAADTQYMEFIAHPRMAAIRSRTVWVHVEVPGQSHDAADLAAE